MTLQEFAAAHPEARVHIASDWPVTNRRYVAPCDGSTKALFAGNRADCVDALLQAGYARASSNGARFWALKP